MKPTNHDDLKLFKYSLYHEGTLIDASDCQSELKEIVDMMEDEDKKDGVYKPKSYKIVRNI
jgi:hypothetical protein